jgi:putative NADH-flavin reductase
MSNIILFGATGTIGQRIFDEATRRGHQVTLFVRNASKLGSRVKPAHIVRLFASETHNDLTVFNPD